MQKVEDYHLSASTRIIMLMFEDGHAQTVSKQSVNNYLADINCPFDFDQLHCIAGKSDIRFNKKRNALLTEYYEHKQNTPV